MSMNQKRQSSFTPNILLKQARLLHNWTQEDLAGYIGTDGYTVNRWERGRAQPSLYFRQKLCELFQQSASELGLLPKTHDSALLALPPASDSPAYRFIPHLRNPCFIGREEILHALHTLLTPSQSVAISGLGGIGKTQVAMEYAYRYGQEYEAIFWIEAETSMSWITSLQLIADQLQIFEDKTAKYSQVYTALQHWFATHAGWLLIVDNLESPELLQMLPFSGPGSLLLTTRRQSLGTRAEPLALPLMDREEGIRLLQRRARLSASTTSDPAAEELVQVLEGLPLALDQAGAYIEETGCSIADYLQRYRNQRKQVLERRGLHGGEHPNSVATTLRLSIEWVSYEHPAAVDLLRACAFLHPDAIPEEMLVDGASYLGPLLGPVAADPYEFDLVLAALRSSSLITRSPETRTLSIHRLVQAVLQDQMEPGETRLWSERVLHLVNAAFPNEQFDTWAQCERYLVQALACVPLIERVPMASAASSELVHKAGSYLLARGRFKEAEPLLEQAITLGEQQYGLLHPALVPLLHRRAELLWRLGRYEQAETLLQQILEIGEQSSEPDSLRDQTANALNGLVILYLAQGKYTRALPVCQRTLHIREQQLGSEHPITAVILNNLALVHRKLGQFKEAEPLLERVLLIQEHQAAANPLLTPVALTSRAWLYLEQGEYAQAEPLLQQALRLREQQVDAEHPDIATMLNVLAILHREQGQYKQAETLFQRALRIQKQHLEPEHPDLATTLNDLARLYWLQDNYKRAEALYQQALHIRKQHLGPEHPDLATTLCGLANICAAQGKDEQAASLYQQALHIQEQHLDQHPDLAQTLHGLAMLRHKQGNLQEAASLAERALKIRANAWGDAHIQTRATQAYYAQLLQKACLPETRL